MAKSCHAVSGDRTRHQIQPSSSSADSSVATARRRPAGSRRLRAQDPESASVPAAPAESRAGREQLRRRREDVRRDQLSASADAVGRAGAQRRHAVGQALATVVPPRRGRCRPRSIGAGAETGRRRSPSTPGAAAVVGHARPGSAPVRAAAGDPAQAHPCTVGCVPVPKAVPGSSRIIWRGVRRDGGPGRDDPEAGLDRGRSELRLRQPDPVALVDRARSSRSARRRAESLAARRRRRRGRRGFVAEQGAEAGPAPAASI